MGKKTFNLKYILYKKKIIELDIYIFYLLSYNFTIYIY